MTTIKGYITYSNFGNTVSLDPRCHGDIWDNIEVYIPPKYKISYTIYDEPLVNIGGKDWMLNEIIYISADDKIYMQNMEYPEKNFGIQLKYKKFG